MARIELDNEITWEELVGPATSRPTYDIYGPTEASNWINTNRTVQTLSPDLQEVGWLLFKYLGMVPTGKKSAWAASARELLNAAKGDLRLVESAAIEGACLSNRLTFKGPRSLVCFVMSQRAKNVMSKRQEAEGVSGDQWLDNRAVSADEKLDSEPVEWRWT